MKKIIATALLACLCLAAGAQSKFDTGTHATSALGQLEEISGHKFSKPSGDHRIVIPAARAVSSAASSVSRGSSGGSALGLAVGILTPLLFSAIDYLEDSRSNTPTPVGTYTEPANPVAPDVYDECDSDIVNKFPSGCKFERHYPVPGDKDWYLELDMTNESSVDHDFTIIFWEKEGRNGTPRLKVLRSGLPGNRIHDPLLGISVNGHYDSGTLSTRYKIEKIIYND
ncbi:MAG: hypothetical protein IKR69_01140 [Bacteroidales bacterium]|nr:hypothetical protein [Bacteroidales bacterium]